MLLYRIIKVGFVGIVRHLTMRLIMPSNDGGTLVLDLRVLV